MSVLTVTSKFQLIGFGAEPKPRTDQDGNPKLFEPAGGKPTYATGGGVIGKNGLDKSVTVATLQPVRLESGKRYQTAGQTWVTPWISGRFIAYSVVCERVEPVEAQAKQ
ncbi:hypothetical protein [Mobiluncus curtisii]|uniref:Uncharacterized protein n=1 Tax=Mobiluncus curtisii ATCC 51333 TaxID=887326 RepID=E6M164_9ACTO|nr:hypothetical protein [Mobiluncus curtisii]EFU79265.1 hypothetical protein HMPREF0388_1851 [Mobiluncus curtisii ATCC 51333]